MEELLKALKVKMDSQPTFKLENMIGQYERFNREAVTNIAGEVLEASIWAAKELIEERKAN